MKIITPKTYLFTSIGAPIAFILAFLMYGFFFNIVERGDALGYTISFINFITTVTPSLLFFYGIFLFKKSAQKHKFITTGLVFNILTILFQLYIFYSILTVWY